MTLLEKIDTILKITYDFSGENPNRDFVLKKAKEQGAQIDIGEVRDILQKLHRDGFLYYELFGNFIDKYTEDNRFLITFEGKFFVETVGSYGNKIANDVAENNRVKNLEFSQHEHSGTLNNLTTWIVRATWVASAAAVIAAIYYLLEIIHYFAYGKSF